MTDERFHLQWLRFWRASRQHREVLTQLLEGVGDKTKALGVWGAGSCHDLKLDVLSRCYNRVHLVDLQRKWIENGVDFQRRQGNAIENIAIDAPVDLAGLSLAIETAKRLSDRNQRLRCVAQEASGYCLSAPLGPFHTLASTGLLSQLLVELIDQLAQQRLDEALAQVATVIRRRHIELMLDHLVPGGHGVLLVDFITSDNLPALAQSPLPSDLDLQIQQALATGNHLFGLQPSALQGDLQSAQLRGRVRDVRMSQVWRWSMLERHYGCFAVCFRSDVG